MLDLLKGARLLIQSVIIEREGERLSPVKHAGFAQSVVCDI